MKIIGALFIVTASFFLGYARRAAALQSEKTAAALAALFRELADGIEYGCARLGPQLDALCAAERFAQLDFLPAACALADGGRSLHDALNEGFLASACRQRLNHEEQAAADLVLCALGCETDGPAVRELRGAERKFAEFAETRHKANTARGGFYEAIYTLCGAAVAILLL